MPSATIAVPDPSEATSRPTGGPVTLFLCGDVMLGRGIDQILPHPGATQLHEPAVSRATTYVELAERANGPIPSPVDFRYVWGDALDVLGQPDVRISNLETSVTRSMDAVPKGINYKMSPANAACLRAAGIDCCALANNHVLDWGTAGLLETLESLEKLGIGTAGAGRNAAAAQAPAILPVPGGGRVLVFAFGAASSGIPTDWAAEDGHPGVNLLKDLSRRTVEGIAFRIRALKRPGDLVVASIHWGGNWGYAIPRSQREFAHALIDDGAVDVVHGHSSHHPKSLEIYRDRPILYGCGDFLNDYEGIAGYEEFRDDLAVMYLPRFAAASGDLRELGLQVFQIRQFRLTRAASEDTAWLQTILNRESGKLGTRLEGCGDNRLTALAR
jgi:poly-gamma-glutamate synthesis protein (capsule biosynthesis protein)